MNGTHAGSPGDDKDSGLQTLTVKRIQNLAAIQAYSATNPLWNLMGSSPVRAGNHQPANVAGRPAAARPVPCLCISNEKCLRAPRAGWGPRYSRADASCWQPGPTLPGSAATGCLVRGRKDQIARDPR